MSELSDLLAACDALAADTHYAAKTRTMAKALRAWAPTVATPAPSPTPTPSPTPGTILPRQGFSNSAQPSASDDRTLDACADLANGHPWWLRFDWWPDAASDARWMATMAKVRALGGTPMGLYNSGYTGRPSITAYAANCATLATKCDLVNVFNEPDMNGWPANDTADYHVAAYAAVKQANPKALVIGPSLGKTSSQNPADGYAYWEALLVRANGHKMFDVPAQHLYGDPLDPDPNVLNWSMWPWMFGNSGKNVKALLAAHGYTGPIICTEAGSQASVQTGGLPGETYQLHAVANGMDARATLGLYGYGVYAVTNDSTPGGFGLKRDDWTNRPAYAAFKQRAL